MRQSCPLSVKGSFVMFVLTAEHMHWMHMVFICVNICPQCKFCCSQDKCSVHYYITNMLPELKLQSKLKSSFGWDRWNLR